MPWVQAISDDSTGAIGGVGNWCCAGLSIGPVYADRPLALHSLHAQAMVGDGRHDFIPPRPSRLYFINSASLSFTASPQISYPLATGCRLSGLKVSGRNTPLASRN